MIKPNETDYDTGRHSQGAFSYPMEIWGDWMQKFVDPEPYLHVRTHRAVEAVEHYFHVLERILAIQREVAKCVVASYTWTATEAASSVREVAKEVAPKRDMHDGVKEPAVKKI
ncbi:MAG: hypothetical protein ACRDRI_22045 [Pseudonocardiaceae bacterium]